ncbi:hypothetical protein Misp01_15440 [Microtetraspora sp. NBRC 13810]|uniref:hypothetical protein n=1 Tax=Microtetraspora sp. NBRC 13810 TaxID=3030990 RepID=UPI0024A5AA33|nr:hypothetical protein [Microtetraspora sp. NBRC 13810]GLW06414.1 hypothetical protein Misp01_15440 [Microtetraspora sp. NBRC 13810]
MNGHDLHARADPAAGSRQAFTAVPAGPAPARPVLGGELRPVVAGVPAEVALLLALGCPIEVVPGLPAGVLPRLPAADLRRPTEVAERRRPTEVIDEMPRTTPPAHDHVLVCARAETLTGRFTLDARVLFPQGTPTVRTLEVYGPPYGPDDAEIHVTLPIMKRVGPRPAGWEVVRLLHARVRPGARIRVEVALTSGGEITARLRTDSAEAPLAGGTPFTTGPAVMEEPALAERPAAGEREEPAVLERRAAGEKEEPALAERRAAGEGAGAEWVRSLERLARARLPLPLDLAILAEAGGDRRTERVARLLELIDEVAGDRPVGALRVAVVGYREGGPPAGGRAAVVQPFTGPEEAKRRLLAFGTAETGTTAGADEAGRAAGGAGARVPGDAGGAVEGDGVETRDSGSKVHGLVDGLGALPDLGWRNRGEYAVVVAAERMPVASDATGGPAPDGRDWRRVRRDLELRLGRSWVAGILLLERPEPIPGPHTGRRAVEGAERALLAVADAGWQRFSAADPDATGEIAIRLAPLDVPHPAPFPLTEPLTGDL